MASVFAWRDFGKDAKDLLSKNFPGLDKQKNLQDSLSVKVSSKAQKGVEFESSVGTKGNKKTESEFSAKLDFEDVEGVQLGVKAKNKPAAEVSLKFSDKLIPVKGLSLTAKLGASGNKEQALTLSGAFKNGVANVNGSLSYPVTKKLFSFLDDKEGETNPLEEQRAKLSLDLVVKPLADKDYYVGASGNVTVPQEKESTYYDVSVAVGTQNDDLVGALYVKNSVSKGEKKEGEEKVDDKKETVVGAVAYTKADDLSLTGHVGLNLSDTNSKYKGVKASLAAGLKRDDDSKLSAKVNIVPDTTVSVGYQQKLNKNVELTFGYAFLLLKGDGEAKTKSSAMNFGLKLSH